MRPLATLLVILVSAIIGEAVFLTLISRQPGGRDASAELLVGGAVAAVLALVSSLMILRSGWTALLHGVVAAVLVYPLWFAWYLVDGLVFNCGGSGCE